MEYADDASHNPRCAGNPAATAETIEPDGWLHTGDIATMDATGHVFVVQYRCPRTHTVAARPERP